MSDADVQLPEFCILHFAFYINFKDNEQEMFMIALITDIDGTLIGDAAGLSVFNNFLKKYRERVFLTYATGRNYEHYCSVFKCEGLLNPDAMILNTGADVYMKKHGRYTVDESWHDVIKDESWDIGKIEEALKGVGNISVQEYTYKYKLSYYINMDKAESVKESVSKVLDDNGIKAKVIISHAAYVDILPEKCDKGEAAIFLMNKMKIPAYRVIVAGDSENDLDLFLKFKKGIIDANALFELKDSLRDRNFYLAKNECASELLEGFRYYIEKGIFNAES